jgi:beta-phosphoglucomutase-like phosphatase (HAD superfamily)
MKFYNTKGIVYDLDGTVVDSQGLHEEAWIKAGKKLGVEITEDFLFSGKGMPNEVAAKLIFKDNEEMALKLTTLKNDYYISVSSNVKPFDDFDDALNYLKELKINVWICTSTAKSLTDKIYANNPSLEGFSDKTVGREMYSKGKPDAEPILVTIEKMKLKPSEVIYVGDGINDYLAALNADCGFIYFCRDDADIDKRIPSNIPRIKFHGEIRQLID